MSRGKKPFLTLLGIGAGVWAASKIVRQKRLDDNNDMFKGKVALVTGASRGIGEALALDFARRGSNIVLAARNQSMLERVASTCEIINPRIETLVVPTDVTDEAQLQNLVAEAKRRFGRIDILVNNAGIMQGSDFEDVEPDEMEQMLEVNLLAPMRLTQLVLPDMLSRGDGVIVNIASLSGRHAMPYFVTYSTSKGGMMSFSEGLRRELMNTGVDVITVSPGYTETQMVTEMRDVYHEMGFYKLISPGKLARRTLDAIALGEIDVKLGALETLGAFASTVTPRLADLYWRVIVPIGRFHEAAQKQYSE